jgi:hypothetical protein
MANHRNDMTSAPKPMTPKLFAAFGVGEVAYIKTVVSDNETAFAIHGADGQQLAVAADRKTAFALILQNNMEGVSLH